MLSLVAVHFALPPDPDRLRPGERVGPCTVEEPLGAGGMGVVYRAQQHLGPARRPVAVKLIHPALLRTACEEAHTQFLAELHILVTLQHESIARIYDGGVYEDPHTHEPLPYLVMELVRDGLPLTTYARDYALTWRERLALLLRVCRAVQYAHEHRVVHRDLKPANILVDPEGHPMVIDFGLACASDALLPGAHLAAAGTPAYMSPEQVSDAFGPISAKSDVYALGLLLYELLTEQLPYTLPHDSAVEELCQVITETMPPPLSQHDPAYRGELDAIVAAALAKRPAERPSVAVLRSRLERALQQLPPDKDQPRRLTAQHDLAPAGARAPPLPVPPEPSPTLPPAASTSSRPGAARSGMPDAERRQLTIMFCGLVDSTQLAGHRDPEDWREVVHTYQQTCAEVIQHFDGSIAQWLGDGVLVYFGWPQAHEDDALRAVRTGLGLLEAIGPLNTRLAQAHGLRLAVRVGIHTGLVVVEEMGDGGQQERLALGDTPNIAARIQGLATPDTIVISAATFHLVEGYFTVEDLGHQALKGVTTPLQVYQVVGASAAQSRLEVAAATGLTPLIGRDADVALLRDRWAQSRDGQGQVVLLSGEAGIGKSRLIEELSAHVRGEGASRMMFRCSPYHTHSAFFPVIAYLQRLLHWRQDESPEARVISLEQALRPYGFAFPEVVPLFAALLSLPLPARYPPLTLSPQRQKQQTQAALVAWLLAEAERQPVLAVWEDLHWADPSSLDFLSMLIGQTPTAPLLLLLACRPEFAPPWPARVSVTQLTLTRFTPPQIEAMVRYRAGGKRLPAEVVQQISAKTEGVPLFVEEVTKTIMESRLLKETAERYELQGPLPALAIPVTLQDALMARLDRLGTAKSLAQLGATIGRQFTYDLLREVAQRRRRNGTVGAGTVSRGGIALPAGAAPAGDLPLQACPDPGCGLSVIAEEHAAAVPSAHCAGVGGALSRPRRDPARAAGAALHRGGSGSTSHPLLAAGRPESRAALSACGSDQPSHQGSGVTQDTARHARMDPARTSPVPLPGHLPHCHQGLCGPRSGTGLYPRSRVCQQMGETPQVFLVLRGLEVFYLVRGEVRTARELGEQLLTLAHRQHDPARLVAAHLALGQALFLLGELAAAREHVEQGRSFYDPQQPHYPNWPGGHPGVQCPIYAALSLWLLGYPEQALARSHEALTWAQELAHPFSLALVQLFAAMVYQYRRDVPMGHQWAEAAITLSTEQQFALWVGAGMIVRGWALAEQGQGTAGVTQIHEGVVALQTIGVESYVPYALTVLAEGYGKVD